MRAYVLALCLGCALGIATFVDMTEPIKDAGCLVSKFNSFSLRILLPNGEIDPEVRKNAQLLKAAKSDVIINGHMEPCLKCDPVKQWADIKKVMEEVGIGERVSIIVDGDWPSNFTQNIDFLSKLIAENQRLHLRGAIITHEMAWRRIMNGVSDFKTVNLWWVNHDNKPDLNFKPFGGWVAEKVVVKQYSRVSVCGNYINLDSRYF